jgi:putative transposase
MPSPITNIAKQQPAARATAELFETWFDPIETAVRDRVHGFIQAMIDAELDEAPLRARYARHAKACPGSQSGTPDDETAGALRGHRHGNQSSPERGVFG